MMHDCPEEFELFNAEPLEIRAGCDDTILPRFLHPLRKLNWGRRRSLEDGGGHRSGGGRGKGVVWGLRREGDRAESGVASEGSERWFFMGGVGVAVVREKLGGNGAGEEHLGGLPVAYGKPASAF